MDGVTLSHWMIGSEGTDGLPNRNLQGFGGRGVAERLNTLFRAAADSGAVLTGQQMSAALSRSDVQRDKVNGSQAGWGSTQGFDSRQSRDIPSVSSTDLTGGDPELSTPWVVHFMRTAQGLSEESLTLLLQACAHLERSELLE